MKVALIFVYNHRYDKNIQVLEDLYKDRFSNRYHLVPFYDGNRPNVIPVYDSSFYFQGYMAQGLRHYFSDNFEHYIFAADDLILNPAINENNYREHFNLSAGASFIPEIFELHNLSNNDTLHFETFYTTHNKPVKYYWWRIKQVAGYQHFKEGVETKNEMPGYAEAEKIYRKHGYEIKPLTYQDIHGKVFPFSLGTHQKRKHLVKYLYHMRSYRKRYKLSYPLVGSYSDLVIVSGASIKKFCHYCGVFAANELFVEFAVPSALLLACSDVITEPKLGKRGDIYWTYTKETWERYDQKMHQFNYNLGNLMENFPASQLYIHPVKLSRWKT